MSRRRILFSSDQRWTALKRAGLAVALALALLLAVLWYGDDKPPSQPPKAAPSQPVVSVPEIDVPVLPKPGAVAQAAIEPAEAPASVTTENAATSPESPKETEAPVEPPKADDKPAKPVSLQDGYFVQLGVFNDTENVNKVLENVTALGMSAHTQSRVVVGPFSDKREAEEARDRLKDVAEGIVLSPQQKTAKPSGKPKAKQKSRHRAK